MSPQWTIAHYRIGAKLGQGGMGEVWRATDTRLNREVAVKILPEVFAADPGRMARFAREAQVLASLNHPNIAAIYGAEERALVMELVEGPTLAERIAQGPIPLDEALPIAGQIAEALEAAHEKGIVHRDLKPANVKLAPGGVVKVLDFGLAKALANEKSGSDPAVATLTMISGTGAILGTAAYMSPEQAAGKSVDRRADIWAFGVVLYEMLTGVLPFPGSTLSEVLAAVLKEEPDWSRAPAEVRAILRHCLYKDPNRRVRHILDAMLFLETASPPAAAPARGRARWIPWAALALVAIVGARGWLRTSPVQPQAVLRWIVPLAAPDPGTGYGIAVSRDGTQMAYAEQSGGSSRIVTRGLDQLESKPVAGSEGGIRPFFSPDGRWLAYFSGIGGALKKIPVTGGTPVTLCEKAAYYGGSWGDDDTIVFNGSTGTDLMQVSAQGGKCEVLSAPDRQKGEYSHRWPDILPGGDAILVTVSVGGFYDSARIAVLDRAKKSIKVLVNGASRARYVPSGHLVYVRGGTLFAVPFELERLAIRGPETPAVERVYYNPSGGFADYAFSDSGLLLYVRETRLNNLPSLVWVDRSGASRPSSLPPRRYAEIRMVNGSNLRLSPDGHRAAVSMTSGAGEIDIWVADLERGALSRLTSRGVNHNPVWTPDGKRVAYGMALEGIYWAPADGSGKVELLAPGRYLFPDGWTPDGKTLLYESTGPAGIWAMTLPVSGGDGKPRMLSEPTAFNESQAQVSPDGRWMAYVSDESGKSQVYGRAFPGLGSKVPISVETGENPRWSANGREIFYFDPARNQVMAVSVEAGSTLRAAQPRAVFEQRTRDWDVSPDGKRFLVRKVERTEEGEAKLEVVVNWFEELARRVPRPQ